jgi:hypothetical protein
MLWRSPRSIDVIVADGYSPAFPRDKRLLRAIESYFESAAHHDVRK